MTLNRTSGSGCRRRAGGSQRSVSRFIRCHVSRLIWPRRLSARHQYQPTMAIERVDRLAVGGNGEVVEKAVHHPLQIEPLLRDRPVHHPPYRLLDLPELLPQPFTNGVPQDEEGSSPARSTDVREAEKGEGFRLAEVSGLALARREAPEFDDPGLLRMQLQPEPPQTLPQLVQ